MKKYGFGVLIVLVTMAFFAFVPALVSAPDVSCYLGLILCIAYPYIMYRLTVQYIKILKAK